MTHHDQPLVYFVAAAHQDLIKIGASSRFRARWTELQAQSPCPLRILGVEVAISASGARKHVRDLCKQFAAHRSHADWFFPHADLLRYIDERAVAPSGVTAMASPALPVDGLLDDWTLPTLMTLREIAAYMHVSPATVRRHVKARNIHCIRVGGQMRFDVNEFVRDSF